MGVNTTIWFVISFARFVTEKYIARPPKKKRGRPPIPLTPHDVAAIVPAHNEELTIHSTIKALKMVLPKENIYVVSDYSSDKTAWYATKSGVNVLDLSPNVGKAKAIVETLGYFDLTNRYKAILINDADSQIDSHYLERALPHFKDKKVAAVAPHGVTKYRKYTPKEMYFIAYRLRLWRVMQLGMRYGMTWRFTNVSYIIPGSLCLYRSRVIKKLEIDAPGLIIEDFNMTFEVHKKRLGKIVYDPSIFGIHQDPYNLRDFIKQVKRWNLGFWQTVRRNGVWPSLFWLSTGGFILELYLYALFIISIPIIISLMVLQAFGYVDFPNTVSWQQLLIGLFAFDYLVTIVTAILERKPIILLYGLGFFFIRYIEAVIWVITFPMAFTTQSTGAWESPARKADAPIARKGRIALAA